VILATAENNNNTIATIPIDTSWTIVSQTREYVEARMKEMNSSEKWIQIGQKLSELKRDLVDKRGGDRRSKKSKNDDNRPTWDNVFKRARDGKAFGFKITQAAHLVTIGEFFNLTTGNIDSPYLPTSWRTLYELAYGFKDHIELFKQALRDGSITRGMTREEAKKVVDKVIRGKGDNKPPKGNKGKSDEEPTSKGWRKIESTANKRDRIAAAFAYLSHLNLKLDDLVKEAP
jgi:hypothetical protein